MLVTVGRIGRAHGIKGEVGMIVRTDEPDRRFADGAVLMTENKPARALTVESSRWHSGRLLVKFVEAPDRTAAENLRNLALQAEIGEEERPEDPEEYYDRELIGLAVRTTDGDEAGEVIDVVHLPSQDLLEIRRPGGNAVLVPLVEELVPEISLDKGYVLVADRPGLLDPEGAEEVPNEPGRRLMRLDVFSIFPEYLAALDLSLVGKAAKSGLLDVRVHDLRDWTHDRHRTVDDTPSGGGAGMVMKPEPWGEALDTVLPVDGPAQPRLIVPTPAGRPFSQELAYELAAEPWLAFACGRYEGIDARVAAYAGERMRVDEVSIGDYVLNGGEVAVLVMVEAVARLLPGVIGNPESLAEESHSGDGLLEYPVYTKPTVLARPRRTGRPPVREPRPDRPVAPRPGRTAYCRAPPGPAGRLGRCGRRQGRRGCAGRRTACCRE